MSIALYLLMTCLSAVIDHEQNILTDQTEWTLKGSLGITPKHVNDDYPMSDQDNKGNWTRYETMSDEFNGDELNADKWTKKSIGGKVANQRYLWKKMLS